MAAQQAPLSLGFSRQEYWSGLPFPSPMNAKSLQSCPTLCDPMDSSQPGSSGPGILQARMPKWVVIPFSRKPSKIFLKDYLAFLILQIFLLWYIHVCFATHLCLFCELSSAFSAYRARSFPSFFFF